MEKFFDVDIFIDGKKWSAKLRDVTLENPIGAIYGKMKWVKKIKIFTIEQSDINEEYQGKGLGLKMYEIILIKLLFLWPECEIYSSPNLNQYSRGVWTKMVDKYYNVKKVGRHFEVIKSEKGIIG